VLTTIREIFVLIKEYHMSEGNTRLEKFAQADEMEALIVQSAGGITCE
jgi:hypothetical protein